MSRRASNTSSNRRLSVPELMQRHSSLLASLRGDTDRAGSTTARRNSVLELEREFPNLRDPSRRSSCHSVVEEPTQPLSEEELQQLLANCTKLTKDNQLTEGRLWGLTLPQHMPEIAKQSSDQGYFNFQKVSFGLDAAMQIYSKRVDSMHNAALDAKSRLARLQKQTEPTSVAPDPGASTRRRTRRQSDFTGAITLATNPETITSKTESEDIIPLDPLFHKTAALFDGSGFKGLPTLKLGLREGARYIVDTTEIPGETVHRDYELPPEHKLDLEAVGIKFEPLREIKHLSQSSAQIYEMLGRSDMRHSIKDLIKRGMHAATLQPRRSRQPTETGVESNYIQHSADIDTPLSPPFHGERPSDEETDCEETHEDIQPDMEEPVSFSEPPQMTDSHNKNTVSEPKAAEYNRFSFDARSRAGTDVAAAVEEVDVFDEETISWMMNPHQDITDGNRRIRAGATHWKYPSASMQRQTDVGTRGRMPRRKETKQEVDFTQIPDVDLSKFKKPDKESSIVLQCREETTTLLPIDHHLKASFLLELQLMPSKKPSEWMFRATGGARNTDRFCNMSWASDNGDEEFEALDIGGEVYENGNASSGFDLIDAPPQVEEERFDPNVVQTRVNMRQIKTKIWSKIKENDVEERRLSNGQPLTAVLHETAGEFGVSFGVCFACSLHLANENNFHIINHASGEPYVILDEHTD